MTISMVIFLDQTLNMSKAHSQSAPTVCLSGVCKYFSINRIFKGRNNPPIAIYIWVLIQGRSYKISVANEK